MSTATCSLRWASSPGSRERTSTTGARSRGRDFPVLVGVRAGEKVRARERCGRAAQERAGLPCCDMAHTSRRKPFLGWHDGQSEASGYSRRGGQSAGKLRELWRYRELLYFLTWRDIKVRYKQTVLGVAWAVLVPVLSMILFTIVFGHVADVSSQGVPYPIFAYSALLPWTLLRQRARSRRPRASSSSSAS